MGPWGFVFLAYGIVWLSLVFYLALLKRRLRRAEAELALYPHKGDSKENEKT
jgi:CcmD family protein